MKPPENAADVKLVKNPRGVYERYIGKMKNGQPKRCRFSSDLPSSQVDALKLWIKWESRAAGINSWEDLEEAALKESSDRTMKRLINEGVMEPDGSGISQEWVLAAQKQNKPNPAPVVSAGVAIAEAQKSYLAALEKRVGLQVSIGIERHTHSQAAHKLARGFEFLPAEVTHLNQLDFNTLQTLVYKIVALPPKKPNPNAKKETQAKQAKESVAARTAIGWIDEIKAFLFWCAEDEKINYILPRKSKELWKIQPVATEAKFRNVTAKELHALWIGAVKKNSPKANNGEVRRLHILLGLNAGFYGVDIATLEPSMIRDNHIWRLRRKTRKHGAIMTKWKLWPETAALLKKYMPLKTTANGIRLSFNRLKRSAKVTTDVTHSNFRDTGAQFMETIGGKELADTYLAHARQGQTDSYSHADWGKLAKATDRFYKDFVKPAITGKI